MLLRVYTTALLGGPATGALALKTTLGVTGYNGVLRGVRFHSHSHGNDPCDGNHSHMSSVDEAPGSNTHHYYEYVRGEKVRKTYSIVDGKKIYDPNGDIVPVKKGAGHGHSHAEYPEMDAMDLSGEDFTIEINPKKKTFWTHVKDFFNPHTPLSELGGGSNGGHSHAHTHASGAETLELYDPKNLTNEGVKITWVGFGVNCGMAVTKFIGGFYFHSQALIADAVHAVGDLISDILTLSTVRFTSKKADASHPFGYGKIETFGSFMVSFILLYAGFQIGWSSFYEIVAPIVPNAVHDVLALIPTHSHSHVNISDVIPSDAGALANAHDGHDHVHDTETHQVANINAAWLALGSIAVKEYLFRATKKVGEKLNSKVLIANAWHHRVDSMTSVVAVATISTGYFLNIFWLDAVGGLIVSTLVMKVGISGVVQSFKELIDRALPVTDSRYTDIEDAINVILMKKNSHVLIKELSILPSGTNLNIVLKLGVSSFDRKYENELSLQQMGSISDFLKQELGKKFHTIKHTSIQYVANPKETEKVEEETEDVGEEKEKEKKNSKETATKDVN